MTDPDRIPQGVRRRLLWPLRLTRLGMAAERAVRLFWPAWTILFLTIAAFAFGLQDSLPLEVLWPLTVLAALALAGFLLRGLWRFRWPGRDEALARLDASLPGRPLATLADQPAQRDGDAGTQAVWQAHRDRMAARAAAARAVDPDLQLADRDPFALRYLGATALAMALLFGSAWRGAEIAAALTGAPVPAATAATGPQWEGWIEPPLYTGRPTLYLNKVEEAALTIPEGSTIQLRLYGDVSVSESVSDPATPVPVAAGTEAGKPAGTATGMRSFVATRTGALEIGGANGRRLDLTVQPDADPTVTAKAQIGRKADGRMSLPFTAGDDYGVTGGTATITLDLAALDRRYGLTAQPEPRDPLVFDLPLPISGKRTGFSEVLAENASEHPWANLPVVIALEVKDGRNQTGAAEPLHLVLPGRRFFDPVAAAVIETRRDLLWTRQNGARSLQILRAITNRPEGLVRNERAYLMLRVVIDRLEAALKDFTPAARDDLAKALWEVALLIEDGGLSDALQRMQQAQERLSEAMRNGASPEEIQKLMQDLKEATDDYLRKLAENMENSTDEPDRRAEGERQQVTGNQIQQMMDEIQKLMEQGRMAEAQELLDQLARMMENLKVTEGSGGEGMPMPGGKGGQQQSMRNLQDTLKGQQGLSDDTFQQGQQGQDRQGQNPQDPGQGQGQPGPEGQGQAQQGQPQDGQDGQAPNGERQEGSGSTPGQAQDGSGGQGGQPSLAERQQQLRRELDRQREGLPGAGTEAGDAARQSLDDAARAMDEAEQALRDGKTSRAIDRQAEAIQNLREGLKSLGQALAQNQPQQGQPGAGEQSAEGDPDRLVPRDPLGRTAGRTGQLGTDADMLQGQDIYRRARDLLDDIRRRAGERTRPVPELDYLRRLLDRF